MANWYGSARSNYVLVEDMQGLKDALEPFKDISIEQGSKHGFCFIVDKNSDSGAWPSSIYLDDDRDEEVEFDPAVHITPYLEDGEILVMQEVGAEKLRYLTGYAQAFKAKTGECVGVSIESIYKLAANAFGVDVESISRAEY